MQASMSRDLGTALYLADELKAADELRHERVLAGSGRRAFRDGEFNGPWHLAIDKNDNVIVADYGNSRIQAISSEGSCIYQIGSKGAGDGQFYRPIGVAVDKRSGHVLVADTDNHRIQEFRFEGSGGCSGSLEFVRKFGSEGSGAGQLDRPQGIAVSERDGRIYVADSSNKRVQVFTSEGDHVQMIGVGLFDTPFGIAVDENDNVYVADNSKHAAFVFDKDGTLISKIEGDFYNPYSICIDEARGHIVVGDNKGVQIRSKSDGSVVCKLQDKVFTTTGVAVDSQGRILASNYNGHTIERWS